MAKVHDRGSWPTNEAIDRSDHQVMDWELHVDGLMGVLRQKGLVKGDEMRRAIESIEPGKYESLKYYERWLEAAEILLIEQGVLTKEQIDRKVAEIEGKG